MIAVYTALFGSYDIVQPVRGHGADFILFTDQNISPKGWEVRRVKAPHKNPCYSSRCYFDQSCLHLPEYEYTIMHGANSILTGNPAEIIERELPDGYNVAAFKHPHRKTVYEEGEACKRMHKDKKTVIDKQMKRYLNEGLPESVRLSACILLIRRNTEAMKGFETAWWREVKNESCRDQLSFDYTRWKLDFPVWFMAGNPYHRSDIFRVGRHNG